MWLGLTRLPSQLAEVIQLLREQNSLNRELIRALTSRPAETLRVLPASSRRSQPLRTAKDIHRYTPQDYLKDREEQERMAEKPWRTADQDPSTATTLAPPDSPHAIDNGSGLSLPQARQDPPPPPAVPLAPTAPPGSTGGR